MRGVGRFVQLLTAALVVGAPAAATGPADAPRLPERGICAHRGARDVYPENTLPALRAAAAAGAQMIEFDLRLSRDSALVVIHDANVDRTTDGNGAVAELTLAELRRLDAGSWMGPEHAGLRVPTLAEVLAAMPRNIWLNLDLKGGATLGERAARAIVAAGRERQSLFACKKEACAAVRGVAAELQVCNMDRVNSPAAYVRNTLAMEAQFIQFRERGFAQLDSLVPVLAAAGVRRNYCCVRTPRPEAVADTLTALYAAGVQFPLVDYLDCAMKAAAALGVPRLSQEAGN